MYIRKVIIVLSLLFLMPFSFAGKLTVVNGKFIKDGVPYYGVGVNYFDGFTRYAVNGKDMSWKAGLKTLKDYNIPFIRMNTFGFWSIDIQNQYVNNKAQFYSRLDEFMAEAATQNVGVIMNLFFNFTALPELNKESYAEWSNVNSSTRKMMRTMTSEIVNRYKNHPALWGWELTNETNHLSDIPATSNNYRYLPGRFDKQARTNKDNYTISTTVQPLIEFSETIRKLDPVTPVFSGGNIPSFNAFHLANLKNGDADNEAQFSVILSRDNTGANTLTMHLYTESEGSRKWSRGSTFSDIVAVCMARSREVGKPFFLGEFGANDATLGSSGAEAKFREMTAAILTNRVPLSAAWAFDLFQQTGTYSVTSNTRTYQLDILKTMNETMATWR